MRLKNVPEGCKKLYNVDPRRQVLKRKVDICGTSGFDLVFDDWCYANYITPSTVECLRIPQASKHYPYILDGYEDVCDVIKEPQISDDVEKYNVLFDDDEITPYEAPSGVKHDGVVALLEGYHLYDNPLWCEDNPPKVGNLFLEDESTLVGKDYAEREGGICFPITSSLCVPILDGMTHDIDSNSGLTIEDTLDEVVLHDTFLYYLFAYDDTHVCESISYVNWSDNRANRCFFDPILCCSFPFDPGVGFHCHDGDVVLGPQDKLGVKEVFGLHCKECSSSTCFLSCNSYLMLTLDLMSLNEICMPTCAGNTFVFDPGDDLGVIPFLRIASALGGVLTWVDLVYDITLSYMGYHALLDLKRDLYLLKCRAIEDLHVWLVKYNGSFGLPLCQNLLSSQVSFSLWGYKPFVIHFDAWLYVKCVHPWHGDRIVVANANPHAMRILLLLVFPMVLQGLDSKTNPFQEGENDANQVSSRLYTRGRTKELLDLSPIHDLGGLVGTLKECMKLEKMRVWTELPLGQYYGWKIAWSKEEEQGHCLARRPVKPTVNS